MTGRRLLQDATGVAIAAVATGWLWFTAGSGQGATPWAVVAVVWAGVAAVITGRRVVRVPAWSVPAAVAVSPLLVAALSRNGFLGAGPLAYENASAALYFLSAAGGLMVVRRCAATGGLLAAAGATAVALVLILLGGSDASTILVAALLVATMLVDDRARLHTLLLGGAGLVAIALAVTVGLGAAYEQGTRTGLLDRTVDATLGDLRVIVWSDALAHVRDRPLTGVGPGAYRDVSEVVAARPAAAQVHNEYLQAAAESGVPGVALLLAFMLWAGWCLWDSPCPSCAGVAGAALVGVALHASVDYVLHFPPVVIGLALLVGAGSTSEHRPHTRHSRPVTDADRRSLRGAAVYGLVLLAVPLLPVSLLNPTPEVGNGAARLPDDNGVRFGAPGVVRSSDPPYELYDALVTADALSVELSVSPARTDQTGPARIVSSSSGTDRRNFTLGQDGDALVVRLRTTTTGLNAARDAVTVRRVFDGRRRRHVVVSYDGQRTRVFVDGRLRFDDDRPGGALSLWDLSYPLLLGNEVGGARPWLGTLHEVAIYDRAHAAHAAREADERARADALGAPLTRYTFAGSGAIVRNEGALGSAGDLQLREGMHVPLDAFLPAFVSLVPPGTLDGWASAGLRLAVYALLYVPAGHLLARVSAFVPAPRRSLLPAVALAASMLEYVCYAQGLAPSWTVPVVAVLGVAVGMARWERRGTSVTGTAVSSPRE